MSWILNTYHRKFHALSEEYESPVMKRCSSGYFFSKERTRSYSHSRIEIPDDP
jgi:hypothetical protein